MEATRAAGGEVDLRPAERAAATAQAEATAAERGEEINLEDLDRVELLIIYLPNCPDIEPSSETVTVQILNEGYDPDIVVIKGTSVVGEHTKNTLWDSLR